MAWMRKPKSGASSVTKTTHTPNRRIPTAADLEAAINESAHTNSDDSTLRIQFAKFCDDGGIYGVHFNSGTPLYVAVTDYSGYPSPLFGIQERMNAYCANRAEKMGSGEFSENFAALQENYACRFSYVDRKTQELSQRGVFEIYHI